MLIYKNNAFTLLEMLLVLFIISIVFQIMTISMREFNYQNKLNKETDKIAMQIMSVKKIAYIKNSECEYSIDNTNIRCSDGYIRDFENTENIKVDSNFNNNIIKINKEGHLNTAGTINIEYENHFKKIVFLLGNGGYYIE